MTSSFISSYNGNYPTDLPLNKNDDPDKTKNQTSYTEMQEEH